MKNLPEIKKALIISVKPVYADLIISGAKTFELRRTRPNISEGHPILLYESSPKKKLSAILISGKVYARKLTGLWALVKNKCGITKCEFDKYFSGKEAGYAIAINDVFLVPEPISLIELKECSDKFHPPQCYRYASREILELINSRH